MSKVVEDINICGEYKVVCPKNTPAVRLELGRSRFGGILAAVNLIFWRFFFYAEVLLLVLRGLQSVTIIHHHSIGVLFTMLLISRSKAVAYYCMDSSFFCVASYNYKCGSECTECISNYMKANECIIMPYKSVLPKRAQLLFHGLLFHYLENNLHKIEFLCQTIGQRNLLLRRYPQAMSRIIGLMTSDVREEIRKKTGRQSKRIDDPIGLDRDLNDCLVFHGTAHPAKGFTALLHDSQFHSQKILFPFARGEVADIVGEMGVDLPKVWIFQPMTWTTGLREACSRALAVLCVSRWSAPIEGALIKSMCVSQNVIVWGTEFSYHSEIPEKVVWRLESKPLCDILAAIEQSDAETRRERALLGDGFLEEFYTKYSGLQLRPKLKENKTILTLK